MTNQQTLTLIHPRWFFSFFVSATLHSSSVELGPMANKDTNFTEKVTLDVRVEGAHPDHLTITTAQPHLG